MRIPIDLPLADLVPPPSLFTHQSTLHGQAHVARVMVHAFRLLVATGQADQAVKLWAAVYLHDIARTHDGVCHQHGENAIARLPQLPHVKALLAQGGVTEADFPAIETAVVHHCKPRELEKSHPHYPLAALLKDADGLDRVRLYDLDASYLRHREARQMTGFAQRLFDETDTVLEPGPSYFERLWPIAVRLAAPRPFPADVRRFVDTARWTVAKTYATTWPHEYIVMSDTNAAMIRALAEHIFEHGVEGRFYHQVRKYHHEDGKVYWSMDDSPETTTLINRCNDDQTYEARVRAGTLPDRRR